MAQAFPKQATPMERFDAIIAMPDAALTAEAATIAAELLAIGEETLESWLASKDVEPTNAGVEGFRLLALHRQGARGDPSFNACRETCRELAYHYNCVIAAPSDAATPRRLRLAAMVARHLVLFIDGKLETVGLGEFCCSARPIRGRDTAFADAAS